ncbi:hypothetical protein KVE66_06945 [Helicobacter pylori]|nr:hypothetical protein KVE66_06945 [Helicobacter pylori]
MKENLEFGRNGYKVIGNDFEMIRDDWKMMKMMKMMKLMEMILNGG